MNFTVSLTYLPKSIRFSIAKTIEVICIRILNDNDITVISICNVTPRFMINMCISRSTVIAIRDIAAYIISAIEYIIEKVQVQLASTPKAHVNLCRESFYN